MIVASGVCNSPLGLEKLPSISVGVDAPLLPVGLEQAHARRASSGSLRPRRTASRTRRRTLITTYKIARELSRAQAGVRRPAQRLKTHRSGGT